MEIHSPEPALDAIGAAPLRAYERALTEAAREGRSADAARRYIEAAYAATTGGEPDLAHEASRRACELAPPDEPELAAEATFMLGWAELASGTGRGRETLEHAVARLDRSAPTAAVAARVGFLLIWLEEYAAAARLLDAAVERARAAGDPWLPNALDTTALVDFRTGRWNRADARAAEALRLAAASRLDLQAASSHTTLARIAAARGEEPTARSHLASARSLSPAGGVAAAYALTAESLLELGLDRPAEAAAVLESLAATPVAEEPSLFEWRADQAEALVRLGRRADAEAVVGGLERQATRSGRRSALAAAARCRGLLAPTSAMHERFAEALRLHDGLPTPFERARTALCFGERLRRSRRTAEAREQLQAALAEFARLGAGSWADRARRELAATRGRARRHGPRVVELLSPHELQVATLVQQGARNREIAAALFVTERTVEYHLTSIYAKLGLRSRTELARAMLTQ